MWDHQTCHGTLDENCVCHPTPIIIGTNDDHLRLSSVADGVLFDANADGTAEQIAWVKDVDSDDGFLSLDRNGNGIVDNGAELFGGDTPQPESEERNGFLALAEFDKQENGGDGDGFITPTDSVWSSLRIWLDANRNGYSEATELHPLSELSIQYISLDYRLSRRHDRYGNIYRYRARAVIGGHPRWAYDVVFDTLE